MSTRHHWADIFIVRRQGPDGRKGSTMNSPATCSTWRGMGSVRLYFAQDSPCDEMRCYRKILHILYKNHVINEEVSAKIQQAIEPHEDLLTIVKRRKLQRYGHVSHSSGLAKTILQGTLKGGRRQGRQRKRWEDNIREWTGLEFGKSQRTVENRGKWRKLVEHHLWCPNDPRG